MHVNHLICENMRQNGVSCALNFPKISNGSSIFFARVCNYLFNRCKNIYKFKYTVEDVVQKYIGKTAITEDGTSRAQRGVQRLSRIVNMADDSLRRNHRKILISVAFMSR